ncbi:MAG: dihydrodipicolinate synthase family protein [Chthonomonadales bacterium]|nr:dihydrodipicolinate synthase family protein [Chthonomonadales bacterium]
MPDILTGIYTALVTPFDHDGQLDLSLLPVLIEFQRNAGVDGLVVAGTNGEGPSLTVPERMRLLEAVLDACGGLPIIAGTGATSVRDAVELTRHASRMGCAGALVLPPFFFKNASPAGYAAAYEEIAKASDIPVILYSIPQFSGVEIGPDVLRALRDAPRVVGVKESSGRIAASRVLLEEFPHLKLFIGSDDLAAELLRAGAAGIISGTANAFPELLVGVWRAHRAGAGLDEAQERLNRAIRVLIQYPVVANMKAALALRGVADLSVRPPLLPLAHAEKEALRCGLSDAGLLQANGSRP